MLVRSKFIFIDNVLDLKTPKHCYLKKQNNRKNSSGEHRVLNQRTGLTTWICSAMY